MTEIPDPVLSELPEGFGLHPAADVRRALLAGNTVELLGYRGEPTTVNVAGFLDGVPTWLHLIPARITPPAPPEPETEWVPLAECLGREVMVDGERRVIARVTDGAAMRRAEWWNDWWHRAPVRDDGMVEVLVVPAPQGEGR